MKLGPNPPSESLPYTFARRSSSASQTVHRTSVTWTLCEAASIKPHFYSGTLHSLRPSSPSRPFSPLAHCSFTTHILWTRPHHRVRAHPTVSRCVHCGFDFEHADSIYWFHVYIHNLEKIRTRREGKHDPRLKYQTRRFLRINFMHLVRYGHGEIVTPV